MEPMRAIFLLALAAVRASATRPHQDIHAGGEEKKARMQNEKKTFTFKVMQFNMLADGLAFDGFLAPRVTDKGTELFAKRVKATFSFMKKTKEKATQEEAEFDKTYVAQFVDGEEKKEESANEKRLVNWPGRIEKILGIISTVKPDIVVMQELDQYAALAAALKGKYTSVKDKTAPEKYKESSMQAERLKAIGKLDPEPEKKIDGKKNPTYRTVMDKLILEQSRVYNEQLQELVKAGVAFAPNVNSNARKYALAEDWGGKDFPKTPEGADDQGVAVFWKTDRFDANEVKMSLIGKSSKADSAALMVELQPKPATGTAGPVRVITTHLSSGADKELRRHHELEDVRKSLIIEGRPDTPTMPTIFATDMNSDIWFDFTKAQELKTNCFGLVTGDPEDKVEEKEQDWQTKKPTGPEKTLTRWGMKSIWSAEGKVPAKVPASVLKMRGPATNQPNKMGDLAFETIDHVFYSGTGLEMVANTAGVVGPMNGERMTKEERQGYITAITGAEKKEGEVPPEKEAVERIVNMMLPSEDTPSDHFPVVAEFALS